MTKISSAQLSALWELKYRDQLRRLIPDIGNPPDNCRVTATVFKWTGLVPSEFLKLNRQHQLAFVNQAIEAVSEQPAEKPAASSSGSPPGKTPDKADEAKSPSMTRLVFRPDGDGYQFEGFGESGHLSAKGAKGLHDLFRLVQTPGVPVRMLELNAGTGTKRAEGDQRSHQPVCDSETLKQIAAKRNQLKTDIESAGSDMERGELETELAKLEEIAKGMRGFNGKARDLNNPNDRLRPMLHKRISTACQKLREAKLGKLADHFCQAVSSESDCMVYRPAVEGLTWKVTNL